MMNSILIICCADFGSSMRSLNVDLKRFGQASSCDVETSRLLRTVYSQQFLKNAQAILWAMSNGNGRPIDRLRHL
jgi:hypothetical protein